MLKTGITYMLQCEYIAYNIYIKVKGYPTVDTVTIWSSCPEAPDAYQEQRVKPTIVVCSTRLPASYMTLLTTIIQDQPNIHTLNLNNHDNNVHYQSNKFTEKHRN